MNRVDLIADIIEYWGWIGIRPQKVVGENDFGNVMIEDTTGRYWRLCPEELSCEVVAEDRESLDALSKDQGFLHDWYMGNLVETASGKLGHWR